MKNDMSPTQAVNEIGKMNFSGNVIPPSWYNAITFSSKKPDLVAIIILSEIVYWYRPSEVHDDETKKFLRYEKKFGGDKLQYGHQQFSKKFGITARQSFRACKNLLSKGLIIIELRTITLNNGVKLGNVMFVEPVPEKISAITFQQENKNNKMRKRKNVTPTTLESNRGTHSNVVGSYIQMSDPTTLECNTNTKITTEITTENTTDIPLAPIGASAANAAVEGEGLNPLPESQTSAINNNENSSDTTGTNGNGSPDHDKQKKSTTEERRKLLVWWNGLGIVTHKNEPKSGKTTLQSALDSILRTGETLRDICLTIENYRDVLSSPQTRFNYKWGLTDFLVRGYSKFTDREAAFHNFVNARLNDNGRNGSEPRDRTLEVYESAMRAAKIADSMVSNA